jgi:hypothetical protein
LLLTEEKVARGRGGLPLSAGRLPAPAFMMLDASIVAVRRWRVLSHAGLWVERKPSKKVTVFARSRR